MAESELSLAPLAVNTDQREIMPKTLKPIHYDLRFEPYLEEAAEFDGVVEIEIKVIEDTSLITLNSSDLKILTTEITQNGTVVETSDLQFDEKTERMMIHLQTDVKAGSIMTLRQTFKGSLLHRKVGFSRAPYTGSDGKQKWMASTDMEPVGARKVFPCFDEPAAKATFSVTLVVEKHLTALGNMDVKSETECGTKKAVTFNKTPPMSTYIVCLAVGELNMIENTSFRVPVRVYAAIDKNIEHGRMALNLAPRILAAFEKIFDMDYPLPKMDLIAVPGTPGAMENWGLITFDEFLLLVDEKETSAEAYRFAGSVLVHEIAHQWFGNIVTMEWWDGLWLNESFADWAELYCWETLDPSWQMWENYAVGAFQEGLELDANRESHAIEVAVNKGSEVNQIFDAISYCKGCAVIRMISQLLGIGVFVDGVRLYLKKHAYGNATTNDLWTALSTVSGRDVGRLMENWTKDVGFPVLQVEETGGKISITQHRFLQEGAVEAKDDQVLYPLSLQLRTKDGINSEASLSGRTTTIEAQDFFKLNADFTGFYRVAYTPQRLQTLGQNAKSGLLSVNDRIGLISDALAIAQSGLLQTSNVLDLLTYFEDEDSFFVWKQVLTTLDSITQAWAFESDVVLKSLKLFKTKLVAKCLRRKGWDFDGADLIEQMFKSLLFENSSNDGEVQKTAAKIFAAFTDGDETAININIRGCVLGIALENGGEKEYEAILKASQQTMFVDRRDKCLAALGTTPDPALLKRTLEHSMTSEVVERNEVRTVLTPLTKHKIGKQMLWDWFRQNFDRVEASMGKGLGAFGRLVGLVLEGLGTKEQHMEVVDFFKGKETEEYNVYLAQGLENIMAKARWVERDGESVETWLRKNGYATNLSSKD